MGSPHRASHSRQGCPFSPSLFETFLEPLSGPVQLTDNVKHDDDDDSEQKLSVYADYLLLNFQNSSTIMMCVWSLYSLLSLSDGFHFPLCFGPVSSSVN